MTRLLPILLVAVFGLASCASTNNHAGAAPPNNPNNGEDFLYDWNRPEPPRSDEIAKGLLIPPQRVLPPGAP
ncbi:MAG: hypothetical protein IT462_08300 [Planctomycetes bacterium]|nr:hypothetical protein [Planctomycetota bacterium]